MDPSKILDNIRAIVTEMNTVQPTSEFIDRAEELSWLIKDLDNWLTNGGFLPVAWDHTRYSVYDDMTDLFDDVD